MEYETTVVLEKSNLEKPRKQARDTGPSADPFTGGVPMRTPKQTRDEADPLGSPSKVEQEPAQSPLLKPGWFKKS